MSLQYSTYMEARMQQKHDVAENWDKINNFVPGPGEIVVYDKDEDFARPRVKIGDGESPLKDLNFFTGEVYTQDFEPVGAKEGAIWITPNGYSSSEPDFEGVAAPSDWDVNDSDAAGYVKNRPIWSEINDYTFNWDEYLEENISEDGSEKVRYITDFAPIYNNISNLKFYLNRWGTEVECDIVGFFDTSAELEEKINELSSSEDIESKIFVINGNILNYPSNCYGYIDFEGSLIGMTIATEINGLKQGTYFFEVKKYSEDQVVTETFNIAHIDFTYSSIEINDKYQNFFKKQDAANVYVLDTAELTSSGDQESMISLLMTELNRFQPGDIILIPAGILG